MSNFRKLRILRKSLYGLGLAVAISGALGFNGGGAYAAVNPLDNFCNEVKGNTRYNDENNTICDSNVADKFNNAAGVGFLDKNGFVSRILKFISFLTGFLAVLFIIVGGLQLTFSGGDVEKVKSARRIVTYALVGVAVIVTSNVILQFAISIANG